MSTARKSFGLVSIYNEITNQSLEYTNRVQPICNNPPCSLITRQTEFTPPPAPFSISDWVKRRIVYMYILLPLRTVNVLKAALNIQPPPISTYFHL